MNVSLPAPSHICAAGVGKLTVWGLRIIAEFLISLCHHFENLSNMQNWEAGRESNSDLRLRKAPCLIRYTTHPLVTAPRIELGSLAQEVSALSV